MREAEKKNNITDVKIIVSDNFDITEQFGDTHINMNVLSYTTNGYELESGLFKLFISPHKKFVRYFTMCMCKIISVRSFQNGNRTFLRSIPRIFMYFI